MADGSVPDIFTDGVSVAAGPYGVVVTLHLSDPSAPPVDDDGPGPIIARLRMNAELAEALSGILKRVVDAHREQAAKRVSDDIEAVTKALDPKKGAKK